MTLGELERRARRRAAARAAWESAATAYAALLSGHYTPEDGEHVAVVVCGANTDVSTLA